MKKLENILLKGCGYTILILVLFYLFAAFNNFSAATIEFSTFALIFAFGMIISLATMILGLERPALPIRILIHYASMMLAFSAIFMASGHVNVSTPANIFTAVIIFTFFYILLFAVVYLIKRCVNSIDKKINMGAKDEKQKKKEYKSLYSSK